MSGADTSRTPLVDRRIVELRNAHLRRAVWPAVVLVVCLALPPALEDLSGIAAVGFVVSASRLIPSLRQAVHAHRALALAQGPSTPRETVTVALRTAEADPYVPSGMPREELWIGTVTWLKRRFLGIAVPVLVDVLAPESAASRPNAWRPVTHSAPADLPAFTSQERVEEAVIVGRWREGGRALLVIDSTPILLRGWRPRFDRLTAGPVGLTGAHPAVPRGLRSTLEGAEGLSGETVVAALEVRPTVRWPLGPRGRRASGTVDERLTALQLVAPDTRLIVAATATRLVFWHRPGGQRRHAASPVAAFAIGTEVDALELHRTNYQLPGESMTRNVTILTLGILGTPVTLETTEHADAKRFARCLLAADAAPRGR